MKKSRVAITDYLQDDLGPELRILGPIANVIALDAHCEDELEGQVEDADALIVYHTFPITETTFCRLGHCRVIARAGVGYDNLDIESARRHNIPVANTPDYGTEEVADSALGLLLSLTRAISSLNLGLLENRLDWDRGELPEVKRLRGRTMGIVGLGRIGTAMALRAKILGLKVIYYDPYKPHGYDKSLAIERVDSLEQLLRRSFVVSVHCPLTNETQNMLDVAALQKLPHGSFLINTARGGVVENARIPELISTGQLAGAGLDVLENEPPSEDHPLIRAWKDPRHPAHHRIILNPHRAFYCEEGILEIREKTALACLAALQGTPIPNVVNDLPGTHH